MAGPLTITFLILKVSGIPMLEKKMAGNPEFAEYKRTTNKFFPWMIRGAHSAIAELARTAGMKSTETTSRW
jgi:steroid 5-alpha reductase family enzyme